MKRIKSAPANIAQMVNRKKTLNIDSNKKVFNFIPLKKQSDEIILREKINLMRKQKFLEKTLNNVMLDYINDKQLLNINDEQSIFISILYYYISEKIFTKNNLREFILFVVQIILRYIITHAMHETILNNHDLINTVNNNLQLISDTIYQKN